MSEEYRPPVPEPDEFDRQLRELSSGSAEPAKFTELSAAERARQAAIRPVPQSGRGGWRNARKARKLRKPVAGGAPGPSGKRTRDPSAARRPPATSRGRQWRSVARTVVILVAFAALVYGLHLLGFGPQGG
jgi:hypothetical protein